MVIKTSNYTHEFELPPQKQNGRKKKTELISQIIFLRWWVIWKWGANYGTFPYTKLNSSVSDEHDTFSEIKLNLTVRMVEN